MPQHPWVDGDAASMDDAAIVRPGIAGADGLVLTVDIITPIVDDPRQFGRIAATNALSDVYAMGGLPRVALSVVGFPSQELPIEMLGEVLEGLADACRAAKTAIVGGHTVVDPEPKCGLAVVGIVDPDQSWSQKNGQAGDVLVLSKPVGTGIVAHAAKADQASPDEVRAAAAQMTMLNDVAAAAGAEHGVRCATDVTGFGLLGHLLHVVEASRLDATIRFGAVPRLPGVDAHAEADRFPGGTRRNLEYVATRVRGEDSLAPHQRLILADAQTSGGLLMCVAQGRADALVRRLRDAGMIAAAIGHLSEPADQPSINLTA